MNRLPILLTTLLLLSTVEATAQQRQQVTVGTPFVTTRDRFFESTNTNWSVNGPGFFARFGANNTANPPFGGFNPNAGIQSGFSTRNGPWSSNFNFGASQGYSRSITSTTPLLTLTNGQPGVFINGVQRPFVTGLFPVVNNNLALPNQPPMTPLRQRAMRGELRLGNPPARTSNAFTVQPQTPQQQAGNSLIDPLPPTRGQLHAQQAAARAAQDASVTKYWLKGQSAEADGKNSVAKLYYEMAIRRASGEMKDQIQSRLDSLQK